MLELCCIFSLGSSLSPSKIVFSSVNINVPVQIQKVLWKFDNINPLAGGLGLNVKVKSVITVPLTCQDNPIIRADERTKERAVLLTPLT